MGTMELRCTAMATGGDAIARSADGRVVFVRGALPGELVRVEFTRQAKDFARAVAVAVLEPDEGRNPPSCPHSDRGCGGCGWQHVGSVRQRELKRRIVVESLVRIGKIVHGDSLVTSGPHLPVGGHRTTVRALVNAGSVGFRAERSNDPVTVDSCEVTDPVLADVLFGSRFGVAREVTLRRGRATGEVLVIVDPGVDGVEIRKHPSVTRLQVVGTDVLHNVEQPSFHETIGGHTFTISAGSFFQTRPDGAEQLVQLVRDGVESFHGPSEVLADLYGGVGLFAATVGQGFAHVVSVEREGCASRDARENLAGLAHARVIASDVDDFDLRGYCGRRSTIVVADPARGGLGNAGVARIVEAGPRGVVLVSCDAASLGRDAGLLSSLGYQLRTSVVVDMFPHTPHVEVVSCFDPPL